MPYRGHVENGVIVLDEPTELHEGAVVSIVPHHVSCPADSPSVPRNWKGLFRDNGPCPTEEDIAQMRQEAWPGQ